MTGHEALLNMRRSGVKPACVWVIDADYKLCIDMSMDWHQEPNPYANKLFAHIRLRADEVPEALDFRCLVGMEVHLECRRGRERSQRLFKAISQVKPSMLMAVHSGEAWIHKAEKNG